MNMFQFVKRGKGLPTDFRVIAIDLRVFLSNGRSDYFIIFAFVYFTISWRGVEFIDPNEVMQVGTPWETHE